MACSRTFAADGPQERTITVTEKLHAMIAAIRNKDNTQPECNTAAAVELPGTTAVAVHAAQVSAVAHTEDLNAAVEGAIMHEHVATAINCNTAGTDELYISTTMAADGLKVRLVIVAQHLHSMITSFSG